MSPKPASLTLVATDGDHPLCLNLGGGDLDLPGYINVDRIHGREAFPLDYPDESCVEIRASHILEHFPHVILREVLKDWVSKLMPGGRLQVAVPDFEVIARRYLAGEALPVQDYLMGSQDDANNYHRATFDEELLTELLIDAGLEQIRHWTSDLKDCASLPVSLNLEGRKPLGAAVRCEATAAVVSVPRYGPTSHQRVTAAALHRAGVPYWYGQGAYWHQVLSEMLEDRISDGARYILTVDYDTIATYEDVMLLYKLMEAYPAADCIVPLQQKRNSTDILFRLTSEEGVARRGERVVMIPSYQLTRNLLPIEAGHFGLTIFRASALRNHPRPWMTGRPNPEGRWGEGRVDADIAFWEHWRGEGRSLYLAPRVVLGHLEETIVWPDRNLRPVHQSVGDYIKDGMPPEARR